ncbi:hypothetical protein BJ546DRAFT_978330 [Cryomyces antarcticus]|nr:hypothetical protein LTR04_005153 [Oleoguttula sp. CCFEE 6159]
MGRQTSIARSILRAVFCNSQTDKKRLLSRIIIFLALFQRTLARFREDLFESLRIDVWEIDEDEYRESFRKPGKRSRLNPIGDLGYSGSTFFTTPNSKFLIKSVPRRFEYSFFRDDMLQPYYEHMRSHPSSLLVRITDFLYTPYHTLGGWLGLAPTHHIIMENILFGKESDLRSREWETYDLKPSSYFFPERDIMNGALSSDATKERLIDEFNDKVRITSEEYSELKGILEADTELLEKANTVDYSLFLIRIPASSTAQPMESARTSAWRTGVTSADGKWKYRAVILDFFWAKHKLQAQAMTGLVQSFNMIARKGPMSITTTPKEYRERFLNMVDEIVEFQD